MCRHDFQLFPEYQLPKTILYLLQRIRLPHHLVRQLRIFIQRSEPLFQSFIILELRQSPGGKIHFIQKITHLRVFAARDFHIPDKETPPGTPFQICPITLQLDRTILQHDKHIQHFFPFRYHSQRTRRHERRLTLETKLSPAHLGCICYHRCARMVGHGDHRIPVSRIFQASFYHVPVLRCAASHKQTCKHNKHIYFHPINSIHYYSQPPFCSQPMVAASNV